MKRISKIIYWTSLISIFAFIVVPLIGNFLPLEFTDDKISDSFEQIRFYGLPVAILLTLFGTIKYPDTISTKIAKTVVTIVLSLLSVFILFITVFAGMCRWTNDKVLFENKKEQTTRIVLRHYGCGAYDSGRPISKVCKIKQIFPLLIRVTSFDTTNIDRQLWKQVDNK